MSDDIARLGMSFDETGASELLKKLRDIEKQSVNTEKATEGYTKALHSNVGAIAASTASMDKQMAELVQLQRAMMGVSQATDKATKSIGPLRSVNDNTARSMRSTQYAGLDLSRQLVDIGVSAQMGINPLTILIQQGPQIADIFQQAAIEGRSFNAVLRAMWLQLSPLLAVLIPIAAVLGAIGVAAAVSAHEINKNNKDIVSSLGLTADQLEKVKNKHVTMTDVIKGTWTATAKAFASTFKDEISAVQTFFSNVYEFMLKGVKGHLLTVLGLWLGAYNAIKGIWGLLPAVIGDITISTANLTLKGIELLVNGAIFSLNLLIGQANDLARNAGLPTMGTVKNVSFTALTNPWAGQAEKAGQIAADSFAKGWESRSSVAKKMGDFVQSEIIKAAQARIKKEAGKGPKGRAGPKDRASATELSDLAHDAKYLEAMSDFAGKAMDREQTRIDALLEKNTRLIEVYERQVALDKRRYDILAEQGRGMAGDAVDSVLTSDPMAETKRVQAAYAEIDRLRKEDVLSEQQAAEAKRRIDQMVWQDRLSQAAGYFGMFASLQNSSNRKVAALGRAAAITQATIDGILAVQKTLASIPFPFNIAAAAAVGASTALNVAKIAGVKGFAVGGYTGDGATGQVAGVTHGQEFVVNANATRRNRSALEAMNSGRAVPHSPSNDNRRTRVTVVKGDLFDAIVEERAAQVAAPIADAAAQKSAVKSAGVVADQYRKSTKRRLY